MKFWMITWGLLALVSIVFPIAIIFGFFLFLPGVLLLVAPTVFFYSIFAFVLGKHFEKSNIEGPFLKSFAVCFVIGFSISFILNLPLFGEYLKVKNLQVVPSEHIILPDTIALFQKGDFYRFDPYSSASEDPLCGDLCQRLLFNGAIKSVIVARGYPSQSRNEIYKSYSIEQGKNCELLGYVSNRMDDFSISAVKARMHNGECLKKKSTPISSTDLVFFQSVENGNERIELLRWDGANYKNLLRHDLYKAKPYFFPLSFGWIISAGSSWSTKFGFFRYELRLNHDVRYYGLGDYKSSLEKVFGNAVKDPLNTVNYIQALSDKLSDNTVDKAELRSLWVLYTDDFRFNNRSSASEQDVVLLKTILKNMDVTVGSEIAVVINKMQPSQKYEIFNAAFDRIIAMRYSSEEDFQIQEIILGLSWSASDIGPNEDQRKILSNHPQKKKIIIDAIEKRIGEGWSRGGDLEKYRALWL